MGVPKNERRESRVEFDNNYFRVYDDAIKLIECGFGSKDDTLIRISTRNRKERYL
jgi:hypothetical protein